MFVTFCYNLFASQRNIEIQNMTVSKEISNAIKAAVDGIKKQYDDLIQQYDEKVVQYEEKIEKMEKKYENKILELESRLDIQMKATTNAMSTVVENRFKVLDEVNKDIFDLKRSLGVAHKDTTELDERIDQCNGITREINKGIAVLEDRAADSEDRSRRNNLKFYDLDEQEKGFEDCEAKVQAIVKQLDVGDIWIDRAHRLGKPQNNKKRPIIARFTYYKDKTSVLNAVRRTDASARGFGVSEDYCKQTYDLRRQLMTHLTFAKEQDTRISGHLSYKTLVLKFNVNDKFIYSRVSLYDIQCNPHTWFTIDFKKRDTVAES